MVAILKEKQNKTKHDYPLQYSNSLSSQKLCEYSFGHGQSYSFYSIWILMNHGYSNCSGLCCGRILDYNLCEKKYANTSVYMIKHISIFYLEVCS